MSSGISVIHSVYLYFAGEEEIASPSLTIENMDRHKGGTYICTADNGVGLPATSLVILHVLCKYGVGVTRI